MVYIYSLLFLFNIFSNYNQFYQNFSNKIGQKTAIAVFCFNRPQYFTEAIKSIELNPESAYLPFFFFLDGGPRSRQKDYINIINNSNIKNKYIITRSENYGIAKNIIDARRFLFEFCNFETLIVAEEDIKINDTFFTFLLKVHDWAHLHYDNIGTVQCWNELCELTPEEKLFSLNILKQTKPFFSGVCYTQTKKVWLDIAPLLYYYEKHFVNSIESDSIAKSQPSRSANAKKIKLWLKHLRNHRKIKFTQDSRTLKFPVDSSMMAHIDNPAIRTGNQDCVNAIILWVKGYERLQTVVNHLIHIGENGCSFNAKNYQKLIMSTHTLSNYDISIIDDYKIIGNI